MTRCNRGVVLGRIPRWCKLPAGHKGQRVTIWLLKDFEFPEPPPRYTAQGVRMDGLDDRRDAGRGAASGGANLTRERSSDYR